MYRIEKQPEITYLLKLGEGLCWQLVAGPDASSWMEEFCRILKLKPCNQDRQRQFPRIFFLRYSESQKDKPTAPHIRSKTGADLPGSGWKTHNFRYVRLWSHQTVPDIICEIGNRSNPLLEIARMLKLLDIIYLRFSSSGGLPLHAALVKRGRQGVLFAGPGGSGKSTLCSRLPRPWFPLCDDQSFVVRDDNESYRAHPAPTWSDYFNGPSKNSWNVERSVRLAAIFFIKQATSDEVVPIGQGKAAALISNSSADICQRIWNNFKNPRKRELKKKMFDNACQLASTIPAYKLAISPNGRFWEDIQKVL